MSDVHPSRRKSDWGSPLVKLAVVCCVISMLCLVVTVVVGATSLENSNKIAKSSDLIEAIQTERKHNTLLSCEQADYQNAKITIFIGRLLPPRLSAGQKRFQALAAKSFPSHKPKARAAFCAMQTKQKVQTKASP